MKISWKIALAAAALALLSTSPSFADTTSMVLTSAGNNVYDNAVFIGPYYAQIGGSKAATPVICDDYVDNSYVPESWTAYVTPETNLTLNNQGATSVLKFGDNQSLYNELGYLANQLMANQGNTSVVDAIQFAMWDLGVQSKGGSIADLPLPAGTTAWMSTALGYANTTFADVTIYSFDVCTNAVSSPCSSSNPPQEFMAVSTPEPSTLLMLALGLGGLLMMWRRKKNAEAVVA